MELELNQFVNYYFMLGGLFLAYLIYRIFHTLFYNVDIIHSKYKLKGHSWRNIQCNKSIPYNIYCNVCSALMLPPVGLFCECCGASACKKCQSMINQNHKCKQITWPSNKPFHHLWVNVGVVADRSTADRCDDLNPVNKYFCTWCQRTKVSSTNPSKCTEVCDFQKYKNIIIPPSCVEIEKGRIVKIIDYEIENWEPLIIFANRKSGSYKGDEVLSIFRGVLNPIQVIDIVSIPPEKALKWLPSKCKILVAGGDGTIAWVLNALHGSTRVKASVGILPMGTGNDLSRSLGWGPGNTDLDAHAIISNLLKADEILLDRWKVTIKPKRSRLGRCRERVLYSYNYTSVGVDAQVALDFHRARSQFLYRYANRTLNYMAYAVLGAGRVLDAGWCDALERRLRVWTGAGAGGTGARGVGAGGAAAGGVCAEGAGAGGVASVVSEDGAGGGPPAPRGRELSLPPLQALVLLNITCWGAGVRLWELGSDDDVGEQYMDDGKLEVVGISSSFHIARLQCGLAEPFRFTQTDYVKIELEGRCAMQMDGEPWMQGPSTITVEPAGQSRMLRAPDAVDSDT